MIQNKFSEAMVFRHACKVFDETKKIDEDTLHYILEAGRLSPSSFGMEPWKFLVISSSAHKEALRPLCWDQAQITSCSHLVVLLAAIESVKPQSGIPQQRFARRPLSPAQINAYISRYSSFLKETFESDERTFAWSSKQCYIALANMMQAAAFEKIDSCPIEGFEKEKVEAYLKIDTTQYQVAVMVALGYRQNEQGEHLRLPFEEVVTFME